MTPANIKLRFIQLDFNNMRKAADVNFSVSYYKNKGR